MKENTSPLMLQDTGPKYDHVKIINGVKFTPREIEVIACLLSGRGAKTIAQFLSIEEKTVETHKYNVMRKLDTNFKEGIIEFVEKSDKLLALKQHYLCLLREVVFERCLQRVHNITRKVKVSCAIVHENGANDKDLSKQIEDKLKYIGIQSCAIEMQPHESLIQNSKLQDVDNIIFMVSKSFLESLSFNNEKSMKELNDLSKKLVEKKGKIYLLAQRDNSELDIPSKISGADFIVYSTQEDFYVLFGKILKALLPNLGIEQIIDEFTNQYKTITDSSPVNLTEPDNDASRQPIYLEDNNHLSIPTQLGIQKKSLIRSDLVIPNETTIIYRDALMSQIGNLLNDDEAIQTIALVGIGGAGKTTVARQCARNHEESVIWEFNAETKESLNCSFENLAYALSETEDEKRMLRGMQEIINPKDKEDKVILFVKTKLKSHNSWFLIYDNVEKFADIQKYFPYSSDTWGKGKVIITTRDSNIQYNNHIKSTIVIGELGLSDRVILFNNIIDAENSLNDHQRDQVESFLNHIPPFPLDVSIAAYYLKTTNLPYHKYIAHLHDYNKDLDAMQQDIIREATQYEKTRYSIITLSLNCFLKTNSEFVELLLLVSLVDPQNILKDILTSFKSEVIVDSFIYHLRKYSLTVCSPADKTHTSPFLTVHRSTKEISLDYLIKKLNLHNVPSLLRKIVQVLDDYASKIFDTMDFDKIKNLKSHCEALLSREGLYSEDTKAVIEGILGAIHFNLGNYKSSRTLLESSLEKLDNLVITERVRRGKVLVYLGMVYRKLGEYLKAKEVINLSLLIFENHMHLEFAWALGNLALVYRHLGNYEKARAIFEDSLRVYIKHFNQDYIGNAWALANLGNIH